jgi:hypothetical protein
MRRDIFQAIADPTRRAIIALIALQAMMMIPRILTTRSGDVDHPAGLSVMTFFRP